MLKRVLSIALSAILCAVMFTGGVAEEAQQVKLYYPSYLQESEALALEKTGKLVGSAPSHFAQ